MGRWCWINFQCWGVLLIWIRVGQGPTVLAVGAGGDCLDVISLVYHFSLLSSSLWETARYRLKYCIKGPLSPNQPTNSPRSCLDHTAKNIRRFYCKIICTQLSVHFPLLLQAPVNIFRIQAQYDSKRHVWFLVMKPLNHTKVFSSAVG